MRIARWIPLVLVLAIPLSSVGFGKDYTSEECPVVGNTETYIYHVPGDRNYREMLQENENKQKDNRRCFESRLEAEKAGYRKSHAIKVK